MRPLPRTGSPPRTRGPPPKRTRPTTSPTAACLLRGPMWTARPQSRRSGSTSNGSRGRRLSFAALRQRDRQRGAQGDREGTDAAVSFRPCLPIFLTSSSAFSPSPALSSPSRSRFYIAKRTPSSGGCRVAGSIPNMSGQLPSWQGGPHGALRCNMESLSLSSSPSPSLPPPLHVIQVPILPGLLHASSFPMPPWPSQENGSPLAACVCTPDLAVDEGFDGVMTVVWPSSQATV
mmetsp:Transcript_101226/g.171298  ORF Transcript_101226/g.171298 Transcript_101226/m.171298 type:complete len:233 (+) Transcript_101226:363-1061(+)